MNETRRDAAIAAISDDLTRAIRRVGALKQQYGVPDPASLPLLFRLIDGPLRATELAELLHVDLSVVSRQLASLAERDLVVKTRDAEDRRAYRVEITEAGRSLVADVTCIRKRYLEGLLSEWDTEDVTRFADYLHRLTLTLDSHHIAAQPRPLAGEI
ncbi:MAG: MarR family transcriptional regulator [Actinobacteria bacterium]|nr:MarR family transcriptional regulator [Actinomycetota bacterium]